MKKNKQSKLQLGIICGGPSLERGISLNSARSVLDHLGSEYIDIHPIYVDFSKNFYAISNSQLYSNTPSDFDFKLARSAIKLKGKKLQEKLSQLDLVFPVIHGTFGEDGQLQSLLENFNVPFIGCDSVACKQMFHKDRASKVLKEHGYHTLPSELFTVGSANVDQIITDFIKKYALKRVIIKPVAGGSSIGVYSACSIKEALEKAKKLSELKLFKKAIIEPFCYGREFTVIVLQNFKDEPIALIPTEIQVSYDNNQIFDYRRKYLPSTNTTWHCPPSFDDKVVDEIRQMAAKIFQLFGMRDFARLDGWLLDDGRILFTDLNPISGMEQNSFIFQQASRVGLTHRDLLWHVVTNSCRRKNIPCYEKTKTIKKQKPVSVLFGGKTSERQISLMSGTNVWLKLRQSNIYNPKPYLLDKNGNVWFLPYTYALNHTVEEIYQNCLTARAVAKRLEKYALIVRKKMGFKGKYLVKNNLPVKMSFKKFISNVRAQNEFLFLGLHGGEGENGEIQQKLDKFGILYNGSGAKASELCMDKFLTGEAISLLGDETIQTVPKKELLLSVIENYQHKEYTFLWKSLGKDFGTTNFIIKPRRDGCSTGIVRLFTAADLEKYFDLIKNKMLVALPNTFSNQDNIIEMPVCHVGEFIVEKYIETDFIQIKENKLIYKQRTGWLEFTVGVIESRGKYHAFNPSITIAEGYVLSVEEKFQGGTGVNITPPPSSIVSNKKLKQMKLQIEKVAKVLGIANYARIDVFFNVKTGVMLVIEANTLPGLTPSTVIYHQALAEPNSMAPVPFLEKIIKYASK